MENDWFQRSLDGDLDSAHRIQYRTAIEARTDLPTVTEDLSDYLPSERVPAPPCPGFERLAKIMDVEADDLPKDLSTYKPSIFYSRWMETMMELNEDEV